MRKCTVAFLCLYRKTQTCCEICRHSAPLLYDDFSTFACGENFPPRVVKSTRKVNPRHDELKKSPSSEKEGLACLALGLEVGVLRQGLRHTNKDCKEPYCKGGLSTESTLVRN
jgi:hypothetical protein